MWDDREQEGEASVLEVTALSSTVHCTLWHGTDLARGEVALL